MTIPHGLTRYVFSDPTPLIGCGGMGGFCEEQLQYVLVALHLVLDSLLPARRPLAPPADLAPRAGCGAMGAPCHQQAQYVLDFESGIKYLRKFRALNPPNHDA
jgi:bacterioferritin-associated ferredoxin